MEGSLVLLFLSFGGAFAAAGGAWAHAALDPFRPIYARGQRLGLGAPSAMAALFACAMLVFPQFDVEYGLLLGIAAVAALAALAGFRATRAAAHVRGALWPLAAVLHVWALAQAIGIA